MYNWLIAHLNSLYLSFTNFVYNFIDSIEVLFFTNENHLYLYLYVDNISYNDVPNNWQIGLQDPATPIMEGIIDFHNHLMFYIILVVTLIIWLLYQCISLFQNNTKIVKFSHAPLLEIVWTLFPTIILMVISVPSFALLYAIDASTDPRVTIKIIGHQWYWSYEYSDYAFLSPEKLDSTFGFDSYLITEEELALGNFRLLETDNRLVLPVQEHIRLIVTSSDVIHSWAIPSFGVKLDAVPGRLNQIYLFVKRPGLFFGQCSEICGVNHGFMPIAVKVVPLKHFLSWVAYKHNWFVHLAK